MKRYALSRLLLTIPTLLGVSLLVFGMLHLIPGDPVIMMLRTSGGGAGIDVEVVRERLGLNDPLPVQYWRFLSKAVRGDLGQAIHIRRPVIRLIVDELPFTLRLAMAAMVFIIVFGLFFGILSALCVNSWLDSVIMFVAVSGQSIANFWLALLLILVFSVKLGWFPIFGEESFEVLLMPAFALGFRSSAIITRMTRSGLLEVLGQDYIRTAQSKGLPGHAVVIGHALKNALIPVVTVLGLLFGRLLGGAVIVETVFARRGLGALTMRAILERDYPLAQGTVMFVATVFVLVNLMVDFLYAFIDPRISYDTSKSGR